MAHQLWTDPKTGRTCYLDRQTNKLVFLEDNRVPTAPRRSQPAPNVPRTSTGAVRQLPANTFPPQSYNQQYTISPPVAAGPSVQNVTRQLQNVSIAQPSAPTATPIPFAAGRPIDGADVLRNPPIRGAPPRRYSFSPEYHSRLLDPGTFWTAVGSRASTDDIRFQVTGATGQVFRSWKGMQLVVHGMGIY